jgi:hypothetical protein
VGSADGLTGCFSADGTMTLATAWEPYQELSQGVMACSHPDSRHDVPGPGATKAVRGELHPVAADPDAPVRGSRPTLPGTGPGGGDAALDPRPRHPEIEGGPDAPEPPVLSACGSGGRRAGPDGRPGYDGSPISTNAAQ